MHLNVLVVIKMGNYLILKCLRKTNPGVDFGNTNLRNGDVDKEPNEGIKICGLLIPFIYVIFEIQFWQLYHKA